MVHIAHMSRSLFPRQILIMTLTWPAGGGGGGGHAPNCTVNLSKNAQCILNCGSILDD